MSGSIHLAYEFSGFRIDPVRRLLSDPDGKPIFLKPKAFETLLYLVEHAGELCGKRDLMAAVWPGLVVEENNLNQCISALRRALGERPGEHKFILTEPGWGYRFVTPVSSAPVTNASRTHEIEAAVAADQHQRPAVVRARAYVFGRRGGFVIIAALIMALGYFLWERQPIDAPAEATAGVTPAPTLADIDRDISEGRWAAAYLATTAYQSAHPGDAVVRDLWPRFSWVTSIPSDPPGATVYWRPYDGPVDRWKELGTTPLENIRVPFGFTVLRFDLDGYRSMERTIGSGVLSSTDLPATPPDDASTPVFISPYPFKLDTTAILPGDMVRVPGWTEVIDGKETKFRDFFLGRYEVTNAEFEQFVDGGGYKRRELWEYPFIVNGKEIPWKQAMALFVDKTGRPGPSTWEAGTYPDGQENFPVSGVSWYEAAAYARSVGRELPTIHHWRRAVSVAANAVRLPASNLNGQGPAEVGSFHGISWTGAYDMSGNVREWAFNRLGADRRVLLGGGWNDPLYAGAQFPAGSINLIPAESPMSRGPTNGFRVAVLRDETDVLARSQTGVAAPSPPEPVALEPPISDKVFSAYRSMYAYDNKRPLNASTVDSKPSRNWTREHITFDAAYGGERVVLYLYIPTTGAPPYQAVVYWPGGSAAYMDSIDDYNVQLDFVLKSGRAVAFPVIKGTFERHVEDPVPAAGTIAERDLTIDQVKDARRTVDYLQSRPDIDHDRLAFFGYSWGGVDAPLLLATEPRLKVAALYIAGLHGRTGLSAEIDNANFVQHVTVPVLLLTGELDTFAPPETSANPFFDLLGTPASDKKHVIAMGGHFVPRDLLIRETLDWLDKYLGPVR